MPEELEEPEVPESYSNVWGLFWDIRHGQELSYTEIKSYCELTGEKVTPWEAETIMWMNSLVSQYILEGGKSGNRDNPASS